MRIGTNIVEFPSQPFKQMSELELFRGLADAGYMPMSEYIEEVAKDFLTYHEGLYVGQLRPEELKTFEMLVEQNYAIRSYEGLSGVLGLAKIKRVNNDG